MLKPLILTLVVVSSAHASDSVIKVDDAHSQIQSKSDTKTLTYFVPSGPSVAVDAKGYTFRYPPNWLPGPINSVQLVLANDQQYSAAWSQSTSWLELSANTLSPNPGSKPFAGLQQGQKGIIAIGHLQGVHFSVVWVGMLEVK